MRTPNLLMHKFTQSSTRQRAHESRDRQSGSDRVRRLAQSVRSGDTIVSDGERIVSVGTASAQAVEAADVVIDAGGMTAIPGLIDSHVHITFGDYTPRQRTVGYLESYLHGGTTTAISASEVHVPGRPKDVEGVKALAVAAQRCFADYRPGGMRVVAGSVILEPGLKAADFKELAQKGVRLAKAGFGAVKIVLRLRAAGCRRQGGRADHHLPHRRLVDPRIGCDHRRSPAQDAPARVVPHQRRADRDAGCRLRARHPANPKSPCRSAPPATCARRCSARGWPTGTMPSTASSSPPTRRPAAASCRSACSTPSRIWRA